MRSIEEFFVSGQPLSFDLGLPLNDVDDDDDATGDDADYQSLH